MSRVTPGSPGNFSSSGGGGNVTIVGPLGQALAAASVPVVLTAAQITTLTPLSTVAATQSGNWTARIVGNIGGIFDAVIAASVPANALYDGIRGSTALPTAVSDGQLVGAMGDKFGRQISLISAIRDLVGTQTTTISASTAETTIVTAGAAGIFNDLVMLIISNTSTATNTRIDFRDATAGTILFSLQSNGGQPPIGFVLPTPIPQTTSANNWTAQCGTSTTDIRVYAVYAKNK